MAGGQDFVHAFDLSPTHLWCAQRSSVRRDLDWHTGAAERKNARPSHISQAESGKHDKVLQMFSINVNLLTNLPMGPYRAIKNAAQQLMSPFCASLA